MENNYKGKYYITTAIAYTSGKPHIGNVSDPVVADAIARFKRMQGYDVYFQTGTDEHGKKNEQKAKAQGVTPQAYVDGTAALVRQQFDLMNLSYDHFIRTTDEYHVKEVQKIFKKLYDQGDIYKGAYEGLYCDECESFLTESQLVDGKCPDCGRAPRPEKEEAYFFKMSNYAQRLIDHINAHPDFIQPVSRRNEMMNNFLLPGLQDLCVSRTSIKWGVPVDFDPQHVVYVWLDALTNYITGIGYHCGGESGELFNRFWPADLHVIGKDITRFHTIYWPIFLMALGLPLPKQVFGHPWFMMDGGKMSKSAGNVLYADDLVDIFDVDAVRYFVLRELPFESDGDITWEAVNNRTNSDLANVLGNLVNRTISMLNKYFDGKVEDCGVAEPCDDDLRAVVSACRDKMAAKMDQLHTADALNELFTLFKRCNKYIDETAPWLLAKDTFKYARLSTVLYNLADSITTGATLLFPFMPDTSVSILRQLGTVPLPWEHLAQAHNYPVKGGKVTDKPEILFQRQELDDVYARLEEKYAAEKAAAAAPDPDMEARIRLGQQLHETLKIGIEDFMSIDLRVAKVVDCQPVKRAKKLLRLTLDDGTATLRTVASGIAQYYKPEELVGRQVAVVSNLRPATLCGVESQGMILAADAGEGVRVLFTDGLPVGSRLR
ncbi:methionine--tRNA ligase [Acutalibacter caecimuris]|uniref:methionine--tRNA ligase n=1 Tax=Acutalibacter caecimuris TaxID=3093657 RepID=UPI002AC95D56|nr:methionine--tRNA ligase [Acutalibacter sp. M00118]